VTGIAYAANRVGHFLGTPILSPGESPTGQLASGKATVYVRWTDAHGRSNKSPAGKPWTRSSTIAIEGKEPLHLEVYTRAADSQQNPHPARMGIMSGRRELNPQHQAWKA
jgi:hypothetical protein